MTNGLTDNDKKLFKQAMCDVVPLKSTQKKISGCPRSSSLKKTKKMEEIPDLINSMYLSDPSYNDLTAESPLTFTRTDLPIKRLRDLRQGQIRYKNPLDLHGFNTEQAKEALIQYISS